jgi:hypothetical protein
MTSPHGGAASSCDAPTNSPYSPHTMTDASRASAIFTLPLMACPCGSRAVLRHSDYQGLFHVGSIVGGSGSTYPQSLSQGTLLI